MGNPGYTHKGDADDAIAHFKKAADYAPVSDQSELDILALETLARAYFAANQYSAAHDTITKALELRKQRGKKNLISEYHRATYAACAGREGVVDIVVWLCKEDPTFFARAAKD